MWCYVLCGRGENMMSKSCRARFSHKYNESFTEMERKAKLYNVWSDEIMEWCYCMTLHDMTWLTTSYNMTSYRVTEHQTTSYHITPHQMTPNDIKLHYTTPHTCIFCPVDIFHTTIDWSWLPLANNSPSKLMDKHFTQSVCPFKVRTQ